MAVNGKVKVTEKSNKKGLVGFFKGLKAEVKRITWPQKKDAKKAVTAVISFCIFYMILISLLDAGFRNVFRMIFSR